MISSTEGWAQELFGGCELGDARRTKRLVDMVGRLARHVGASMAKCCRGDSAAQSGSYRLLRNDAVDPQAIAEGGFGAVAQQARHYERLLAVEDTTTLSFKHAVADKLGPVGSDPTAQTHGYLAHSVLLIDTQSECTLGLIDQRYWRRDPACHGQKHTRKQRAYEDKESVKWQRASQRVTQRLGPAMAQVISVADRESDIYEYLRYKHEQQQRYVVRANVDRCVEDQPDRLFTNLETQAPIMGYKTVEVSQRGGRKARQARLALRAMTLTLSAPARTGNAGQAVPVYAILAQEIDAPKGAKPLRWRLLTSEPIDTLADVKRVVRDYELRWRIEDFHKAWKSGVGVERQRLQSTSNLERMAVITAFIAVRLLRLREAGVAAASTQTPVCDTLLDGDEWHVLWASTESVTPPEQPPSTGWAFQALAKMGGFTDTKRTGYPGWAALWSGWFRLQERLEGYRLSQQMQAKM